MTKLIILKFLLFLKKFRFDWFLCNEKQWFIKQKRCLMTAYQRGFYRDFPFKNIF